MVRRLYQPMPKPSIDADLQTDTAAADTAVVITLLAATGTWILHGVSGFYSAAPTDGVLTVAGGGINYRFPITGSGCGFIPLPPGGGGELSVPSDGNVVITLGAGGGTVVGTLNVHAELYIPA